MKTRLSVGKNLKSTATPQVTLIKNGDIAVLRIEIELLKADAGLKDDGDFTSPSDEPLYRDAAIGETIALSLRSVVVGRINNQGPCEISVTGVLGTKVPHTPE